MEATTSVEALRRQRAPTVRRLARPSRTPPPLSPQALAARPPGHGSRPVRPQPVREAWSTGAEVAGAPMADAPSAPARARSRREPATPGPAGRSAPRTTCGSRRYSSTMCRQAAPGTPDPSRGRRHSYLRHLPNDRPRHTCPSRERRVWRGLEPSKRARSTSTGRSPRAF